MDPKNLGIDPKDWQNLNWFEKAMEIILERFERIGKGLKLRETAAQAEVRRREFEVLIKAGEAQPWAVEEHMMDGHRVTDPKSNVKWLNDFLKFYEKQGDEKSQHYEIIGEYDANGTPTGRARIYRINGPRELRKMRARGG